jgi:hypothetical protein
MAPTGMTTTTLGLLMRASVVLLSILLVAVLACLWLLLRPPRQPKPAPIIPGKPRTSDASSGTCSAATCGATDPVSDPAYNMREIATQCILLEEHLSVDAKYCVDCIAKHLLHCHGLANEAAMLASSSEREYPYMHESAVYFQGVLERWLDGAVRNGNNNSKSKDIHELRLVLSAELREYRKRLVDVYVTGST